MRGRGGARGAGAEPTGQARRPVLLCSSSSFGAGPELRRAESLFHRELHQGVLRACPRNGAAITIHAFVVADPQDNRTQAERFLALHDALAAAVALLLIDDVFVEIVGRVFGVGLADGLARNGVARAEFFAGQSLLIHRAGDVEVRGTNITAPTFCVLVDRPDRRQRDHTLRGAELAGLRAGVAQAAIDAARRIHLPDHLSVSFLDQENGAAAECREHAAADHVVQQIPPAYWFAHTVTGSKTKMASLTVSAT